MQNTNLILTKTAKSIILTGCALALLAIILGAFGAHALEPYHSDSQKITYETGIRYHFFHAFAIILTGLLDFVLPKLKTKWVFWCFAIGILFFSGSLYLLSLGEVLMVPTQILGPITPVGGLLFILGWMILILKIIKVRTQDRFQ